MNISIHTRAWWWKKGGNRSVRGEGTDLGQPFRYGSRPLTLFTARDTCVQGLGSACGVRVRSYVGGSRSGSYPSAPTDPSQSSQIRRRSKHRSVPRRRARCWSRVPHHVGSSATLRRWSRPRGERPLSRSCSQSRVRASREHVTCGPIASWKASLDENRGNRRPRYDQQT